MNKKPLASSQISKFVLFMCLAFALCACEKSIPPKAPLPDMDIKVVEFNQVFALRELIAGYIPAKAGTASPETVSALNIMFKDIIANNVIREIPMISPLKKDGTSLSQHQSGRHSALLYWAELGQENGADILLLPQILAWNYNPENLVLKIDFFILATEGNGTLLDRSQFELVTSNIKPEELQKYVETEFAKAALTTLREFRLSSNL